MTIWMLYIGWALLLATGLLWRLFRGPRCAHDWEPVVERELPSRAEILKANGENLTRWNFTTDLRDAAIKIFFAIISCKKCGEVKEFRTENK